MQRTPGDDGVQPAANSPTPDSGTQAARAYVKPEIIEYGPLAKLTQGQAGSTGEGANTTRRMCL